MVYTVFAVLDGPLLDYGSDPTFDGHKDTVDDDEICICIPLHVTKTKTQWSKKFK